MTSLDHLQQVVCSQVAVIINLQDMSVIAGTVNGSKQNLKPQQAVFLDVDNSDSDKAISSVICMEAYWKSQQSSSPEPNAQSSNKKGEPVGLMCQASNIHASAICRKRGLLLSSCISLGR